ncbi:MAG: 30S ribosome-binding factor RbfA [Flavobacteriaceae bacterium]|nr:30S ribosome-binding factor RbfA [Flavobacteriaceae bacterium]
MIESNRQKKMASVLQKDLVEILQGEAQRGLRGVLISVTKVYVTSDLGEAKIYVSIFPSKHREKLISAIKKNTSVIRYELARRTKNQLRRMPVLHFYADDSLDYIEGIDHALKGNNENPI